MVTLIFDGPAPHVLPILQSSKVTASKDVVEVTIGLLATPGRLEAVVLPLTLDSAVNLLGQLKQAIENALRK